MPAKLKIKKLGVVLAPTKNIFESVAVLNPAIYQDKKFIHVFYRAIDKRFQASVGYAKLEGPTKVVERLEAPLIKREYEYEKKGVEDPRIVKIGDTYYMTYVAHDGKNAVTAYAVSRDLVHFKKMGIISPQMTYDKASHYFRKSHLKDRYFMFESYYEEFAGKDVLIWEKDIFLFPRKIKGKFALIHRILPDIQIMYFRNFKELQNKKFWEKHLEHLSKDVLLENKYWFESRNIGGGAPPVYTKHGWVFIFHTVEELNKERVYRASAALLDRRDPTKVIGRLNYPLFSPEEKWEKKGFVDNVVFPTGTAVFGKDLYIYYGAADKIIGVCKVNLNDLIKELKRCGTSA